MFPVLNVWEIGDKKIAKIGKRGVKSREIKRIVPRGVRNDQTGMKNDQEVAENNFQCPHYIIIQALHNTSVPAGPHYYESHPPPPKKTTPP